MKFNSIILAILCLASCSSIKSRYYEGIKEPQNVLDFTALFQKNLKYEKIKKWHKESLLAFLPSEFKGKSLIIASAQIIRGWAKHSKNDPTYQNLLKNEEWFVYKSPKDSFAIFINKEIYRDAINQINKKLNLEKIGLSKKLIPITLETNPLETLEKEFSSTKAKILGPLNTDDFYSIFSANSNIKKRAIVIGHGTPSKETIIRKRGTLNKNTLFTSTIIALSPNQFLEFTQKFAKLNGEFLGIKSCYGHGWNNLPLYLKDMKSIQSSMKKSMYPFAIAFLGGSDSVSRFYAKRNPALFFKDLHLFLTKEVKSNWREWLQRKPWIDIRKTKKESLPTLGQALSHITRKGVLGQPFVKFPGTNFFRPVSTTESIKILTNPVLLRHEIETTQKIKSGNATDKNYPIEAEIKYIFLYTGAIHIPIVLETNPESPPILVSGIPGPAQHYFVSLIQKKHANFSNLSIILEKLVFKESLAPKFFFFADFICENHRSIGAGYPILPTSTDEGKTLHLKNLIIKTVPFDLSKFQKIYPEYLCKDTRRNQYFHATYNPKTTPTIQFKKISKAETKEKIARWLDETTPAKLALFGGTIVETPKKIRNAIDRALKIVDLKTESELLTQDRKEKETAFINKINQKLEAASSAVKEGIKNVNHLISFLKKVSASSPEEFAQKLETNVVFQIDMQTTANKILNEIHFEFNTNDLNKKEHLLPKISHFIYKSSDICVRLLTDLTKSMKRASLLNTWKKMCSEAEELIKQKYERRRRPWRKLATLKATLPDSLAIKTLFDELFEKIERAIDLFKETTCSKVKK